MQGNVLMWLLLTVFLGMEECEGNSGRSLEQEHIWSLCMCGRRGSAVTAWDKSALRAHCVFFARLPVGGGGKNIAIKSLESICRFELISMSLFYPPQVIETSCLFQNCGSLGLDD